MKHLRILAVAAAALMGAATAASAEEAYTTNDVSLRAGPGTRFPVVRVIPEDAVVYLHGCLRNWDWCDVSWRRSRGWVFSDYLEGLYGNRRLGFAEWRQDVELPFVSFGFGYWDRHYRDRPWYGSWERWGDRNDRRWREHRNTYGEDGDWSGNRTADDNWNRSGDNEYDNRGTRRARRNTDHQRMQCAPDDPACDDAGSNRRGDQQMDDADQQ